MRAGVEVNFILIVKRIGHDLVAKSASTYLIKQIARPRVKYLLEGRHTNCRQKSQILWSKIKVLRLKIHKHLQLFVDANV